MICTWRVAIECKNRGLRDLEGDNYDATNFTAGWSQPGTLGLLMMEILPHGWGQPFAWICFFLLAAWISLGGYAGAMENGRKFAAWHGVFKQYLAWVIKRYTVYQKIKSILFCQLSRKSRASFSPNSPRTTRSPQATALARTKHELDASSRERLFFLEWRYPSSGGVEGRVSAHPRPRFLPKRHSQCSVPRHLPVRERQGRCRRNITNISTFRADIDPACGPKLACVWHRFAVLYLDMIIPLICAAHTYIPLPLLFSLSLFLFLLLAIDLATC